MPLRLGGDGRGPPFCHHRGGAVCECKGSYSFLCIISVNLDLCYLCIACGNDATIENRIMELLYIHWNPDPVLFSVAGIAIRWYSIFWLIAIWAGCQVVYKLYKLKGLPMDTFQTLFMYSFLGIFIGARLGHCLFYEPDYYLSHPLEIILPIRALPDGGWRFTGYAGLASHGGHAGVDYRSGPLLPQDQDTLPRYSRHDGCSRTGGCRLYPAGQPDELRNHRHAGRCALGFCLRTGGYVASSSGTALRGAGLFHLLRSDGVGGLAPARPLRSGASISGSASRSSSSSAFSSSSSRSARSISKAPCLSTWVRC